MGADAIALPMLGELTSHFRDSVEICGVFTQPDKRSGRGMKLQCGEIKKWAIDQSIPLFQPVKIGPENLNWLRSNECKLILVMAYGHILRQDLLDIPALETLNFHSSLLPAYRGPSPIEAAIASGEEKSGVTLMSIIPALDAGPILESEEVSIGHTDTSISVREKISLATVSLLKSSLPDILAGRAKFKPQDSSQASFTRLLIKDDSNLDFKAPARDLFNRIRAMQPWPGSSFKFKGIRIKVGRAQCLERTAEGSPGEVIGDYEGDLLVATGRGVLQLQELQRPGGRMLDVQKFLHGFPIPPQSMLKGGSMPPLSSPRRFKR